MTLILALGNSEQVIQIADRRLTADQRVIDDDAGKAGVLVLANARFAYGFAGLARAGNFRTRYWLLDALRDAGPPDFSAAGVLNRFAARASRDFRSHPELSHLASPDKRLSVLFSGYLYNELQPRLVFAVVTNYQDFASNIDHSDAWPDFRVTTAEARSDFENPTLVQVIGMWSAVSQSDAEAVRPLLEAKKPASAILGKGISLMAEISGRPAARQTIGKYLSSITIPVDRRQLVPTDYHAGAPTTVAYLPDLVVQRSPQMRSVATDAYIRPLDPNESWPSAVPKVGRNHPCPCQSGQKYKHCHGR